MTEPLPKDFPYVECESVDQYVHEVVKGSDLETRMNELSRDDWDVNDPERIGDPEDADPMLPDSVRYILTATRECCVCATCRASWKKRKQR